MDFTKENLQAQLHKFEGYTNTITPNDLIKSLLNNPISQELVGEKLADLNVLIGADLQEMLFDFGGNDRTLSFENRKEVADNLSKIENANNYYYMDYASVWVPVNNDLISSLLINLIDTF